MGAGQGASLLSPPSSLTSHLTFSSSSSPSPSSSHPSSLCPLPSRCPSPSVSYSSRSPVPPHHPVPHAMASRDDAGTLTSSSNDGVACSTPSKAASAIDFLTLCERLKTTKRKGWVNHGLKESESIADHMYRMAVMAIISADMPGINRDRCVKMAVVHDIAEAIVGDITPSDNVPKAEKSRREREAIDEMCSLLGGGFGADEVKELWLEYETNSSPEAKLVKDFDKVEMILQAVEYETAQGKVLDDFFESTAGKFQTDLGKAWAAEVVARRRKRFESLNQ